MPNLFIPPVSSSSWSNKVGEGGVGGGLSSPVQLLVSLQLDALQKIKTFELLFHSDFKPDYVNFTYLVPSGNDSSEMSPFFIQQFCCLVCNEH